MGLTQDFTLTEDEQSTIEAVASRHLRGLDRLTPSDRDVIESALVRLRRLGLIQYELQQEQPVMRPDNPPVGDVAFVNGHRLALRKKGQLYLSGELPPDAVATAGKHPSFPALVNLGPLPPPMDPIGPQFLLDTRA